MLRFKLKERIADLEFRERRRLPLVEIAAATGIGRITLSRMLNHSSHVRTDTLERLCVYFGCRIDEIVEFVPEEAVSKRES